MTTQAAESPAESRTARLLAVYGAYQAGSLARPDAEAALAAAVYAAKVVASRLADITVSTLAALPPVGVVPGPQHLDRLSESVSTVLEQPDGAEERLRLLLDAEAAVSEQKATTAAIRLHGYDQWREDLAADACRICQPFRDRLHDSAESFEAHHPRCRCKAVPVGVPGQQKIA